jgi:hypothetical protein
MLRLDGGHQITYQQESFEQHVDDWPVLVIWRCIEIEIEMEMKVEVGGMEGGVSLEV